MIEENKEDYVLVFEAPKLEPPEFRLYYEEETGKVLFYTCEKLEGKYIVIDAETFAAARPEVRIINGSISTVPANCMVNKLIPCTTGVACAKEDISIIVTEENEDKQYWKLKTYELS